MSEHENDYGIGKTLDDDYIDVEEPSSDLARQSYQRAEESEDLSEDTDEHVTIERTPTDRDIAEVSRWLDVADGSGASSGLDELIDQNAVIDNDGRSDTRTFFYPNEAADSKRYRRLIRWQDGEGASEREAKNRKADQRRYVDTFCGRLDMTPHQQRRVQHVVDDVNMSHMGPYSSPKVILAIISLVANEDNWFVRDDETFMRLVSDVDSSLYEVKKIRVLLREKTTEV